MSLPKPYYQDESCTIYNADCREFLPLLPKIDLVLTDPPYGIGYKPRGSQVTAKSLCKRNFGPSDKLHGDSGKLDIDISDIYKRFQECDQLWWGANYYANCLPRSKGWLVWFKARDMYNTKFSHAEMAWTNLDMSIKVLDFKWMGMIKDGEQNTPRVHPTQKPLKVINWCFSFFPHSKTILDPFMGSGTTLRAAKDLNRKAIGIEIEEKYCEIAARRLQQEVFQFGESA